MFELLDDVYQSGETFVGREWKVKLNRTTLGLPPIGYFNFVLQPSRSLNGEVEGILIHVMEVTDQVTSRHEVERRERLLQVAQRAANAGSFEWNLETGEMEWTAEFYDIHGIARSTAPAYETWKEVIRPEDLEYWEHALLDAVGEKRIQVQNEYRIATPEDATRWMAMHGRLFYNDAGEALRLVGITIDITQRKRAEDALRRSEKLAATGRLAASIAHEINNPLEAVTNLLYLADSDAAGDRTKAYLELAQKELARVSNIATQTLRFYRQSAARSPANVADLMDSVLHMYNSRLQNANVRIVRKYGAAPDLTCLQGEIRQVLANLVGNSLDAMKAGGTIHLRIREVNGIGDPHSRGVQITVADTGSGIPEKVLPHIFEPFVTTKDTTGTGLGLWVSFEIIRKHSGRIRVRSRTAPKKNGTVFTIFLPYDAAETEKQAEGAA
jgi:PAS domain S-box-containing protein